jgi:pentatricopeptide repeat protein
LYFFKVSGFGRNGMALEAIKLYRQMPKYLYDEVTHICVLNACSHSGLLDEARSIFNEISTKTENIVTTMVCLFDYFV